MKASRKYCRLCKQVYDVNMPSQCTHHEGYLTVTSAGRVWTCCAVPGAPQMGKISLSQMQAMHTRGCIQGVHWWVKEKLPKKNSMKKDHSYLD